MSSKAREETNQITFPLHWIQGHFFLINKEEMPSGMSWVALKCTHPYLEPTYLLCKSAEFLEFLLKFQNLGKRIHSRDFFDRWLIYNGEWGPSNGDSENSEGWVLGQSRGSGWAALSGSGQTVTWMCKVTSILGNQRHE